MRTTPSQPLGPNVYCARVNAVTLQKSVVMAEAHAQDVSVQKRIASMNHPEFVARRPRPSHINQYYGVRLSHLRPSRRREEMGRMSLNRLSQLQLWRLLQRPQQTLRNFLAMLTRPLQQLHFIPRPWCNKSTALPTLVWKSLISGFGRRA
jgi:hypothetical protein